MTTSRLTELPEPSTVIGKPMFFRMLSLSQLGYVVHLPMIIPSNKNICIYIYYVHIKTLIIAYVKQWYISYQNNRQKTHTHTHTCLMIRFKHIQSRTAWTIWRSNPSTKESLWVFFTGIHGIDKCPFAPGSLAHKPASQGIQCEPNITEEISERQRKKNCLRNFLRLLQLLGC